MKLQSVESTFTIRFVTVQKNSPEIHPEEPVVQERPNPCILSPFGNLFYNLFLYWTVLTLFVSFGPNSKCQVVSNQAQYGCQDGMIGSVPNCRPNASVTATVQSGRHQSEMQRS